jgi:hypothetical protein
MLCEVDALEARVDAERRDDVARVLETLRIGIRVIARIALQRRYPSSQGNEGQRLALRLDFPKGATEKVRQWLEAEAQKLGVDQNAVAQDRRRVDRDTRLTPILS